MVGLVMGFVFVPADLEFGLMVGQEGAKKVRREIRRLKSTSLAC
jgi:hypothetical protein